MKITELKCPHCGAALESPTEDGPVTCKFCGNTFYMEKDKPPVTVNTTINNFRNVKETTAQTHAENPLSILTISVTLFLVVLFVAAIILISPHTDQKESLNESVTANDYSPVFSMFIQKAGDVDVESITAFEVFEKSGVAGTVFTYQTGSEKEQTLDINDSELNGETLTLCDTDISAMTSLKKLGMDLNCMEHSDQLTALKKLSHLTEISICSADEVKDWSVLGSFPYLEKLEIINAAQLSDASFLNNMPKLDTLSLVNTGIDDLSPIANRISLLNLDITGNPITDYEFLLTLTSLKKLTVDQNAAIPDLSGLKLLKTVNYQ